MNEELVCNQENGADRMNCLREMDALEERKETRKMRFWVVRLTLIVLSAVALSLTFGGLYGWLFKEKEFLDSSMGVLFTNMLEVLKMVFGT